MESTDRNIDPEKLVTLKQIAAWYGVTEQTVRNWISANKLPAERIGPRVIRVKAGDALAMSHAIPTVGNLR
ncbi:excisionase family DNA binding protein [Kribbella rubisoli]|uniref:Excisionase family DNA binding protein n=1 Tax=Kribbella rubisoli TaxID=3075929 RepID=A0A4V2FX62_9ACTN|nr:helix-turn-helix domain-containing protein [Kribbella rubisoli]RZU12456.1 excisionase family DNA binding protein [Kribbella rubisoli]